MRVVSLVAFSGSEVSPHLPETTSAVWERSASVTAPQHLCQTLSGDSSLDLLLHRHLRAPLLLPPPILLQVLCYAVASRNTPEALGSSPSLHPLRRRTSDVPQTLQGCPPHSGLCLYRSMVKKAVVIITTNLCSQPHPVVFHFYAGRLCLFSVLQRSCFNSPH